MTYAIRDYCDDEEASWLRCRVLSFLGSAYYDDVKNERTAFAGDSVQLVATAGKPDHVPVPGTQQVDEAVLRQKYARVHRGRRYLRPVQIPTWTMDPSMVATDDAETAGRWDPSSFCSPAATETTSPSPGTAAGTARSLRLSSPA